MIAKTLKHFLPIAMIIVLVVSLASCKKHEHKYDRKDTNNEYLKSEQTCDTAETYYYSCSCGQKGTETFEVGSPLGHSYSSAWSSDSAYHWNPATCGHADQVNNKTGHTWDEGLVLSAPTESAAGEMLYTCTVCQYTKRAQLPTLDHTHTFDTAWYYDDTNHWHKASCGHDEVSAMDEHAWNDGEITLEPTESAYGVRSTLSPLITQLTTLSITHIFRQT